MSLLSSTSGSPCHCCILGKGALGSMVKQWGGTVKAQKEGNPHCHDYG